MKRSAVGVKNGNWRGGEMRAYVRDVSQSKSKPVPAQKCTYCGGDVERNPMKQGVCYGCYQELISEYQEAQKIAAALKPYFDDLKTGLLRLSYNPIDILNDHYNVPTDEPPAPEAEAQATEVTDTNEKWLDVEHQTSRLYGTADLSQDWGETSDEYKKSQPYHNDLYPF